MDGGLEGHEEGCASVAVAPASPVQRRTVTTGTWCEKILTGNSRVGERLLRLTGAGARQDKARRRHSRRPLTMLYIECKLDPMQMR